jgi:FtsP/CotA-like multicopper oxidase with cupredoxin domain
MGQRVDLLVDVPAAGGAFPILALREGARERAGLVLATPGAAVPRVALLSDAAHPAFGLAQEAELRAAAPLAPRRADRTHTLALTGSMTGYTWSFDARPWGTHRPLTARAGERVEIAMVNRTMMAHPIHLHGHAFQVVAVDGRRLAGALRDTVHVPPMAKVTVALDAGAPARWMLHCHHMPHLATGMMTEFKIAA